MYLRPPYILVLLAMISACGSRRVAGYLEDLEDCSSTSSGTSATGASDSSGPGDDTSTGGSAETTVEGSESTDTSSTSTESTTETSGTTEGTTGEPVAVCGNGMTEDFGPVPEECDDGNVAPNDGCSEICALDRQVFVTSVVYNAGELQSLKLADTLCGNLADDQGFADALKYRAWLSDSMTDARDRFTKGRGRLIMVNGLVLADSWAGLLAGELQHPFEVTEMSETYHGGVWTGTQPDGTVVPDAENCDDWSTDSFQKFAYYGYSDLMTSEWTLSQADDNPSFCPASYALYCLQSL